jgi:hypothetical protein
MTGGAAQSKQGALAYVAPCEQGGQDEQPRGHEEDRRGRSNRQQREDDAADQGENQKAAGDESTHPEGA